MASFSSSRRRNYMMVKHRKDELIEFMRDMLTHSFVLGNMDKTAADSFSHFEELIEEHRNNETESKLGQMMGHIGVFFTHLPLREAYLEYDQTYCISKRQFIKISFNEIRHILNLAQVRAIGSNLKMATFDGDETLYADGKNFDNDELASLITKLMLNGVYVAIVTAAGYGHDPEKYQERLIGLLEYFKKSNLNSEALSRFLLVGGECNFLFRLDTECRLNYINRDLWAPKEFIFPSEEITRVLDTAEIALKENIKNLNLDVKLIRKERAIGVIAAGSRRIKTEALDEMVLHVQDELRRNKVKIPYCAFNGGRDVWVDVGNKRVGVTSLQKYLNIPQDACIHIGDQFLNTGNDFAARNCCPCIWITSPSETMKILKIFTTDYF